MRTALEFGFTVLLGSITYLLLLSVVGELELTSSDRNHHAGLLRNPKDIGARIRKDGFINFFLTCNLRHKKGGHLKKGCILEYLLRKSVILYQSLLVGGN